MNRTIKTDQIEGGIRRIVAEKINLHLERGKNIDTDFLRTIWFDLIEDKTLRLLFEQAFNMFQEPFNDFIFFRLFSVFLARRDQMIHLPVKWKDDDLLMELIRSEVPSLVLSRHGDFSYGTREIVARGRNVATISTFPNEMHRRLINTGLKDQSRVAVFPRNQNCLLHLFGAMRAQKIACCYADFREKQMTPYTFVSPAIFEFAARVAAHLWFAKYNIDDSGFVIGDLRRAKHAEDPAKSIQEFINFVSENNVLAVLRVGKFEMGNAISPEDGLSRARPT